MRTSHEFDTLLDFLGRWGPEVEGHHLPTPESPVAARLLRFARGECDETEREELCRLLRAHPAWLQWMADQVKRARQTTMQM